MYSFHSESYLEKLNSSVQSTRSFDPIPQFDFGDRATFPVKPNSERAYARYLCRIPSHILTFSAFQFCLVFRLFFHKWKPRTLFSPNACKKTPLASILSMFQREWNNTSRWYNFFAYFNH